MDPVMSARLPVTQKMSPLNKSDISIISKIIEEDDDDDIKF
jgi:hypothetical protein